MMRPVPTQRAPGAPHAAPAGGARGSRGRSCVSILGLVLAVPAAHAQETVAVPSGQTVALQEILLDDAPGTLWARFRFIAPQIAPQSALGDGTVDAVVGPERAGPDMDHLCAVLALPYLAENGISADRIVISLADRALPFGAIDPEATQFFEAYRQENALCIWEEF